MKTFKEKKEKQSGLFSTIPLSLSSIAGSIISLVSFFALMGIISLGKKNEPNPTEIVIEKKVNSMSNIKLENNIKKYQETARARNHLITVFLTSSNRKKYIRYAIESILNQDYKEFCFLILDNFSNDGTAELVHSYKDERLFFIQRESRLEEPNSVFAFSICVTRYIVVFHDDDIVEKNYLSVMLPLMKQSGVQLLSPSANIIDESGTVLKKQLNNSGIYLHDTYLKSFLKKDRNMAVIWFPASMYQTNFYRNMSNYLNII